MAEAIPGLEALAISADGAASNAESRSPRKRRPARSKSPAGRRRAAKAATPKPRPAAAEGGNRWLELVLSVVQAPVGIAQSQTEFLVGQLEKTGSLGQREAERLLNELRSARERAQGRAEQEAGRLDSFIESKIEDVLNRVNIPSRSDIERLNQSVDVLTAKVEALLSRQEPPGARGGAR